MLKRLLLTIAMTLSMAFPAAAANPADIVSVPSIASLKALGAASAQYTNASVVAYYSGGTVGGGRFTWSPASTATPDNCTVIQATGVTTGRWIRVPTATLSVTDCGAKGDGSTNDTTALQAALTGISTGGTVIIPGTSDCYLFSTALSVAKAMTVQGPGRLCTSTAGIAGIVVTASNVTLDGIVLTGAQYASYNGYENAVYAHGTFHAGLAPTYITNFVAKNLTINGWGAAAIQISYVNGFYANNNRISNLPYAGIVTITGLYGTISNNVITGISGAGVGGSNAYGILVTRDTADSGELTS